ncbi:hypothetical protein ACQPXM_06690 [Kribbella sp. CA-253562]|uniref:hypothetical protein n=1 Tax=Kribbella sp. CA-253562 TaxID=3239942 RepID=UPI003D918DF7
MARSRFAVSFISTIVAAGTVGALLASPTSATQFASPGGVNAGRQTLQEVDASEAEKERFAAQADTGPQSLRDQKSLLVSAYSKENGGLGTYYDHAGGKFVIRRPRAGLGSSLPLGRVMQGGVDASTVSSKSTKAEVDGAIARLTERTWSPGAAQYSYGFYYHAKEDVVKVTTNAPSEVMKPLLDRFPGLISYRYDANAARRSRTQDPQPHRGGAHIEGIQSGNMCTSGFTFRSSTGRYMVTAGHCYSFNEGVMSPNGYSGWGRVVSRPSFPAYDMEALGGSAYGSVIYVGNQTGTTILVGGAGTVAEGGVFCESGAWSAEVCGREVVSTVARWCDTYGCTPGLLLLTSSGSGAWDGDSGGPVYNYAGGKVYIRGMIVAASGLDTYAEKWTSIQGQFSATIATS